MLDYPVLNHSEESRYICRCHHHEPLQQLTQSDP